MSLEQYATPHLRKKHFLWGETREIQIKAM